MKRTLTLKSEALSELTTDELAGLVGAAQELSGGSCPALGCKLSLLHVHCPSELTCPTE